MKRIISLMLTLAVTLSLLVLLAGAASTPEEALGEVNIYSGGYSMKYLAVNGKVQTQSYTYFLYATSTACPKQFQRGRASVIWLRRRPAIPR